MHAIQEWINNHLIEWGIISSSANELDNTIVLLLIIAVTVGIDYACRYIFLDWIKVQKAALAGWSLTDSGFVFALYLFAQPL